MAGNTENELCYYAEVTEPKGYEQANSTELQEQYEFRLPDNDDGTRRGRQRVRKTTSSNGTSFVQTLKVPNLQQQGPIQGEQEYNQDIDEDFWKAWRLTYCTPGVLKQRYNFLSQNVELRMPGEVLKLPEVTFEIDVFYTKDNKRSRWVKIDIEIQHLQEYLAQYRPDIKDFKALVSFDKLPLGIQNAFPAITQDESERRAIDEFWQTYSRLSHEGL